MAKVQGKKRAAGLRKSAGKKSARPAARKAASRRPPRRAAPPPKRKTPAKPPKPATRRGPKTKIPPRRAPQAAPPKSAPPRTAGPSRPAVAPPRTVIPPKVVEKKRTRRSRPKVSSGGVATAAWFSQGEKPRPSSFIPAPPRAEAPSLIAAPPASSDRLVSEHELTEFVVRTAPVRVDVEAGGGRVFLSVNPDDVTLRAGEGIEWDFRYLGGADVIIDELIIEFNKPSPFSASTFRSRRPGTARPHRQLSGPVHKSAAGKRMRYTIRAMNAFKSEMATTRPWVTIAT